MRVVALDIGEKRIGVAASDASGVVASPVTVLDAGRLKADLTPLKRIAEDYEPEVLLVGLPLSLDGSEGPQAESVRRVAVDIGAALGLPVEYADERFSSAQAERLMADAGLSERQRRGKVDAVAASIFLQSWLDASDGEALNGRG